MERQEFLRLSRRELLRLSTAGFVIRRQGVAARRGIRRARPRGPGGGGGGRRGLPDQSADPRAVQRSAARPEGAGAVTVTVGLFGVGPRRPDRVARIPPATAHQIWPTQLGLPDPIVYRMKLQVDDIPSPRPRCCPSTRTGCPRCRSTGGTDVAAGTERNLPPSTIYGFNGTFPGPMINAEYGRPVLVRFESTSWTRTQGLRPRRLRLARVGLPDAPAQRPHGAGDATATRTTWMNTLGQAGYYPQQWCDNLYLN